jgi:hypothetical protein
MRFSAHVAQYLSALKMFRTKGVELNQTYVFFSNKHLLQVVRIIKQEKYLYRQPTTREPMD